MARVTLPTAASCDGDDMDHDMNVDTTPSTPQGSDEPNLAHHARSVGVTFPETPFDTANSTAQRTRSGILSTQTNETRRQTYPMSSPARQRPPSSLPTNDTPTGTSNSTTESPHPASPSLRGQGRDHANQGRRQSVLDCRNKCTGDAQASPPIERNYTTDNPVETIIRRIQEVSSSARAKALQTAGEILRRVNEKKLGEKHVRDRAFYDCVNIFERNPSENITEMAYAFQLASILIYEGLMKGCEFKKMAQRLWEEGYQRGFQILVHLVHCDSKVNLTNEERKDFAKVVSLLEAEGHDESYAVNDR